MDAREIAYDIDGKTFTGYLADGSKGKKVPGILVAYEAGGMTEHPKARARMLAEAGYVAFAMDTFGEAIRDMAHAMSHVASLSADLATLRKRANVALDLLKAQPNVDAKRMGAIGFALAARRFWNWRAAAPISVALLASIRGLPPLRLRMRKTSRRRCSC